VSTRVEPATLRGLDELCVNTIRMLAVDAVEKANSGHPGLPMGAASMAYVLWTRHLRHDPRDPLWPDRDRFVLSAGHGSMLLYALLFLTGYDLTIEDLKSFRQWESKTPGHPEVGAAPGVEVTTGPLGQGMGNALGLAMAERWLAATYGRPGHAIVDHRTWVLASDGDMMEGISSEAGSLAGHLGLGRLNVLYDCNRVTLSATTDVTFTEDVGARFEAFGWHVQHVAGDDLDLVDAALRAAAGETARPSLIVARTHLGAGSPHKHDTFQAHGEPLGKDETRATKRALGWPEEPAFHVPDEALREFRRAVERGATLHREWERRMDAYRGAHESLAVDFERALAGRLPAGWAADLPRFAAADGPMATRDAGAKALAALAARVPELIGGSGDLDPSTRTVIEGGGDFEAPRPSRQVDDPPTQGAAGGAWDHSGRNLHFGVREHVMTAALTGMARHGGVLPYGATFLTFSDYMRPAIRLAALSRARVIYVWTHDSIALGEDGPTHQPVEHLASLRAMPGLVTIRPADANETVEAWRVALAWDQGPVGLMLTRQKVPVLDRATLAPAAGLERGAYVLAESTGEPQLILVASGSEVALALEAHRALDADGVRGRVVSMPSWELFEMQPAEYRDSVFPRSVRARVAIEAASPFGWERYVGVDGAVVGVETFGASAPGPEVMRRFGFTPEHVVQVARAVLRRAGGRADINR
jgi:transketolase